MKHFGRARASAIWAPVIAAAFFIAFRGDAAELVNTIKAGKPSLVTWAGLEGTGVGVEIPAGMLLTQQDSAHGAELWITNGTPLGTHLVRDINPGSEAGGPSWYHRVGDVAVFLASDGIHGSEVWRSDGTDAGTYMLADIGPGKQSYGGSPVFSGVVLDGVLYFAADDTVSGSELWRTDGTREGTFLAVDIVPGYVGSDLADLTVAGGRLYFSRYTDGLWVSDGTTSGTRKLADVIVSQCCAVAGNAVFFSANDEVHGIELWRAIGETVAMVENLNTEPIGGGQDASSHPEFVTARAESVLFIAQTRATAPNTGTANDCKLFRANASGGGATELRNFQINCSIRKIINLPGGMIFSLPPSGGPAPGQHDELWVSDGTAAGTMPLDLNGLYYSTVLLNDYHFKVAYGPNGEAYFFGTVGSGQPDKIWRTDGTRAGTRLFADLSSRSAQQEIIWLNGRVYFDAGGNTSIPDTGLWTSDGTVAGTTSVRIGDISNITDLRIANGRLQFWSATAEPSQRELWSSDGTSGGTVYLGNHSEVTDNAAVDASVVFAGQLGSRAVFAAQLDAFALGRELSITDGTKGNSSLIRNINIGGSADPGNFLTFGDQILFSAHDFDHGRQLWRTDGTESGTFQLQDIVGAGDDAHVTLGGPDTIINGVAYFTAGENQAYPDLWRTDGTIAGTSKVSGILALRIHVLGGNGSQLLFRALKAADNRTHLYSWNGSQAQIITAADGLKITSDPGAAFDGRICFRAWDVDPRYVDVWCASGMQGDMVRATNFAALGLSAGEIRTLGNKLLVNVPGSGAASGLYSTQGVAGTSQRISAARIRTAAAFGGSQLAFLSESGNLMLTDGTSVGTRNLLQGATLPGAISGAFGVLGSHVVFVVNDPARGAVLWRSDGTPAGTRYIADLDPATVPAGIQESSFFTLDNRLLYSGFRKGFGNEMWSLNATDPNASNDVLAATAGSAIAAALLDNDADFDGALDAGSVSIVTQPSHGTAAVNAATGAVTYTANSSYNGSDELTYRVSDTQGNSSNVATLSIQVTGGVSSPPPPAPPPSGGGGGGGGGGALGLEILALMLFAFRKAASIQSRLMGRTGWNSRRLGGSISMTASSRG
jgi:ELWxxDGT repeat protein